MACLAEWVGGDVGRNRHFQEEASLLERQVLDMGARGGLLGNAKADVMLRAWVPSLCDRVLLEAGPSPPAAARP